MSLVDYASSDEEEDASIKENEEASPLPSTTTAAASPDDIQMSHRQQSSSSTSSTSQASVLHSRLIKSSSDQHSEDVLPMLSTPIEKLPDASLLLSSPLSSQPVGTDHSSRVAAAMAENASRKRESNGSSSPYVRGKIPRGNLPHSKNIPDTSSGLLMPPQLRGRSNVVTEDISKLFVKTNLKGKS